MRLFKASFTLCFLSNVLDVVSAASSWGFRDATVSIQTKRAGVGGGQKETYADTKPSSIFAC